MFRVMEGVESRGKSQGFGFFFSFLNGGRNDGIIQTQEKLGREAVSSVWNLVGSAYGTLGMLFYHIAICLLTHSLQVFLQMSP